MSSKNIDLDCTIVRETEKAVLLTTDVAVEVWVPKSWCDAIEKDDPDEDPPCQATISIWESRAIEKELI
jgi:hypothetical protein